MGTLVSLNAKIVFLAANKLNFIVFHHFCQLFYFIKTFVLYQFDWIAWFRSPLVLFSPYTDTERKIQDTHNSFRAWLKMSLTILDGLRMLEKYIQALENR